MASILYVGTHGPVDTTRATLPFILSVGAIQAGHSPRIALLTEAVLLAFEDIASQIQAVGFPALKDLLPQLLDNDVPIYV
jgi:predicted peroxiredoxin